MPNFPLKQDKKMVISLGGSLIVPDAIDTAYLKQFREFILTFIDKGWEFIIITGGGASARNYIQAAQAVLDSVTNDDLDWLGIHASRFNGHLVRTIFREVAQPTIILNPEESPVEEQYKVIVAAGWKPGWSTDYVSVKVAERVNASYLVNLSNVKQVYTDDPRKNPQAEPIDDMLWNDYCKMAGDTWTPGLSLPFDPIAAKLSRDNNLNVLIMDGSNLDNFKQCIEVGEFVGTVIHN